MQILIDIAENRFNRLKEGKIPHGCIAEKMILKAVKEGVPLVTPQEPRKGHWIKGYTFPDGTYWKCDKCNELIKVKIPMHYCNNCGADMREVEE